MDIDNITEEEALDVLHKLRTKFHWAGTVFMKDDIIYRWKDKYGEEEGQALSDEQIESVMTSWDHNNRSNNPLPRRQRNTRRSSRGIPRRVRPDDIRRR